MNAHYALKPTSAEWEVVRNAFYIATPDDFPEGCGVVFNPDTGEQVGIGKNRLGATVRLRLYTPLCEGCDNPIPGDGLCSECCLVHADVAGVAA